MTSHHNDHEVPGRRPSTNPSSGPAENNEGALMKWGKRALIAGVGGLALAGLATGGVYAFSSPETQKSITDGLQTAWKTSSEGITKAGGYVSEQAQRFGNYITSTSLWQRMRGTTPAIDQGFDGLR